MKVSHRLMWLEQRLRLRILIFTLKSEKCQLLSLRPFGERRQEDSAS